MGDTDLTFKQALNECRGAIKQLRAFTKVEAVLATAANAEMQLVTLTEKVKGLSADAKRWEGEASEARARYTSEQIAAGTEMDRLAAMAQDRSTAQERKHEEALTQADREVKSALTAGELAMKQLTGECRELEARRVELEEKLQRARADYEAFREKVGVS